MAECVDTSRASYDDAPAGAYLAVAPSRQVVQRAFDLAVVLLGAVVWVPVMAVIAALVKLDSRGPVFYRQTRIGLHRAPFVIWKFRKMRDEVATDGPMLTMRYDNRETRVGRILERTKLDELPQVLNVLTGTMSIVGPRPDVPRFVECHPHLWDRVLSVKPGIFGASQNHFRNESELYPPDVTDIEAYYIEHILPDMLRLDGEYAAHATLRRDVALLVDGVARSVFGSVTPRALASRWTHLVHLAVVITLGGATMSVALMMTIHRLPAHVWIVGGVSAAIAAVASAIPSSSALSLTVDDGRRILLASATRSGIVALVLMVGQRSQVRTATLVADGGLFLAGLFAFRVVSHLWIVHHVGRTSGSLRSRMVWFAVILAPISSAAVVTVRHGVDAWTGEGSGAFAAVLAASLVVRPSFLLLARSVRPNAGTWLGLGPELAALALATVAGSGYLLLVAGIGEHSHADVADAVLDAVVFGLCMLVVVMWQRSRMGRSASSPTRARPRAVVIGDGALLASYLAALDVTPRRGFDIVGVATFESGRYGTMMSGHRVVGSAAGLSEIARTTPFDHLVVLADGAPGEWVQSVLRSADGLGSTVDVVSLAAPAIVAEGGDAP